MRRYTKKGRLNDVISLISLLALEGSEFKDNTALNMGIRNLPLSRNLTWYQVALLHPEFFRPNGANTHVALVIRSYLPFISATQQTRPPLTIDETQKLIDVAITLHDKELLRIQRFGYTFPLIVAIIGGIVLFGATCYSVKQNQDNIKPLKDSLQQIKILIEKKK